MLRVRQKEALNLYAKSTHPQYATLLLDCSPSLTSAAAAATLAVES